MNIRLRQESKKKNNKKQWKNKTDVISERLLFLFLFT